MPTIQTPATFTPDNVTMMKAMSGAMPSDIISGLMEEVIANSAMMQLARYIEMNGQKEKEFDVYLDGLQGYWVGEGQRIETTKPTWAKAKLTSHKLATILPVTREFLSYKMKDFFDVMKEPLARALYTAFDNAVFANIENPFGQSIEQAAGTRMISGAIDIANYDKMIGSVLDLGYEPSAVVSKTANVTSLRGLIRDTNGLKERAFDAASNTIDGLPVVNLNRTSKIPTGTLYAGDFDYAAYGIPYSMTYKLSEEATLTTVKGEDGEFVNLYERDMMALRVVMDVAFMIINDDAFAGIKAPVVP